MSADLTVQLEEVIVNAITGKVVQLHTAQPGVVLKYDSATQLADVQPALMRKYPDGRLVKLPPIANCPVWHPSTDTTSIHIPLKPGSSCMIVWAERSIDNWTSNGGVVDPQDTRMHHLSDAMVYPGGQSKGKLTVTDPDAIEIKNSTTLVQVKSDSVILKAGSAEIDLKPSGEVAIKGSTVNLGADAGASFVALADKVESRLSTLESFALSHEHPTAAPGPPSPATPPFVADMSVIAATKVKAT